VLALVTGAAAAVKYRCRLSIAIAVLLLVLVCLPAGDRGASDGGGAYASPRRSSAVR